VFDKALGTTIRKDAERIRVQRREEQMAHEAEMYARPAAERFVDKLDESIAELKQRLDKWADDFKEAPAYRLEWSQTTFEQAAQWRVLVIVRDALTGDRT